MDYFVVYGQKEIIDGPLPYDRAHAISEDLEMVLEDKRYRCVGASELVKLGLSGPAHYHIQEDTPE